MANFDKVRSSSPRYDPVMQTAPESGSPAPEKAASYFVQTHASESNVQYIQPTGRPGKELFGLGPRRLVAISLASASFFAASGFAIWLLASTPRSTNVSPIQGSLDSSQLATLLTAVVTVYGIGLRLLTRDLGSLILFSTTYRHPVQLHHLNALGKGGASTIVALFRYSPFRAVAMAVLLLTGASIVPVGTLTMHKGQVVDRYSAFDTVGIPSGNTTGPYLSFDLQTLNGEPVVVSGGYTPVLNKAEQLLIGKFIEQGQVLSAVPSQLSVSSSLSAQYVTNATYPGVITFLWSDGCVPDKTTQFNISGNEIAYTFADGNSTNYTTLDAYIAAVNIPNLSLFGNVPDLPEPVHIALAGQMSNQSTGAFDAATVAADGVWITRVACLPTLTWALSTCTWNGTTMILCSSNPGSNTTVLDTDGLDSLALQLKGMPYKMAKFGVSFGVYTALGQLLISDSPGPEDFVLPPTMDMFHRLFGHMASSITTQVVSGYYGNETVLIDVAIDVERVLIRVWPVVYVALVGAAVGLVLLTELLRYHTGNIPVRPSEPLHVASATRGLWWDQQLHGLCAAKRMHQDHADSVAVQVKFGDTMWDPPHVGFAIQTEPVQKERMYWGTVSM